MALRLYKETVNLLSSIITSKRLKVINYALALMDEVNFTES